MKVVLVAPTNFGGHPRYVSEVANALSEHLIDTSVLTAAGGKEYPLRLKPVVHLADNLDAIQPREEYTNRASWILSRIFHYAKTDYKIAAYLKKFRPRVAWFQEYSVLTILPLLIYLRSTLGKGVVLALTAHNIEPHNKRIPAWLSDFMLGTIYRRWDLIVVHDRGQFDLLTQKYKIARPKVVIAPHAVWTVSTEVESSAIPVINPERDMIETRVQWLLCPGVIRSNKNANLAVLALKYLPDSYRLRIAGKVEDDAAITAINMALHATPESRKSSVELITRYLSNEELTANFREASAVLLPYSSFSAQSGILFDCVSMGCPVVASNGTAMAELVNEYGVGECFDMPSEEASDESAQALASAIMKLKSKETYSAAFVAIKDDYSWSAHARLVLSQVERLG